MPPNQPIQCARAPKKRKQCAYCGIQLDNGSKTRDHVVPSAMWGGKGHLPPAPFLVPSCDACRSLDEGVSVFRNAVVAQSDTEANPIAHRVLYSTVDRHLTAQPQAMAAFCRDMRLLERRTGTEVRRGLGFYWPESDSDPTPHKITRGLFFKKTGLVLPASYEVTVYREHEPEYGELLRTRGHQLSEWEDCGDRRREGVNAFRMRYLPDPNWLYYSIWQFEFYSSVRFFTTTSERGKLGVRLLL